jgi:DNA repair photolyase
MGKAQPKKTAERDVPTTAAPSRNTLPRVIRVCRNGKVLHSLPGSGARDVLSLNLAQGCVHRCAFCSIRAHSAYRGDEVVYLYGDTSERLREELEALQRPPRAVVISPATDPFPPVDTIQAAAVEAACLLAEHGIEAWLMTRGFIRPAHLGRLALRHERLKVIVGLTTQDRSLQRALEPLAAPPKLRLRQIHELLARGIDVQISLEPLVPGLTDRRENLLPLLESLAALGIRHVSAGYLFMRPGIEANMARVVGEGLLDEYASGPVLSSGTIGAARYLPKARRQRGYAALMALAAPLGIEVSISSATNPDFSSPPSVRPPDAGRPLFPRFAAMADLLCPA